VLVTVRPGVDREQLRRTLFELHISLTNLRSVHTTGERYSAYLAWVANSVRRLRGQISPADVGRLVLTPRCVLLQSKADSWTAMLAHLVDIEIDDRDADFTETIATLANQLEHWKTWPGRLVVADTSFYVQHPDKLLEADLSAVLQVGRVPIRLIVPIIVADELDGLKQATKQPARWRASYTLGVLDVALRAGPGPARLGQADPSAADAAGSPRGEVTVEIVLDPRGHTRLSINDDEIVDRALAIQSFAGREVTLLTYDTGQATRARVADLNVLKLIAPAEEEPIRTRQKGLKPD